MNRPQRADELAVEAAPRHIPAYSRAHAAVLFAITFASNALAGLVATVMSTYLPQSVQELTGSSDLAHVGRVGGYIGSLFLVGWLVGGMLLGWAGDRFGRVRSFTGAVLACGAFTLVAAAAPTWPLLAACRFMAGFGVGGILVVSAVIVAEGWSRQTRAVALGFVSLGFPIGIIASGVLRYADPSWRSAMLVGIVPVVLALVGAALLRECEHWREARRSRAPGALHELREMLAPGNLSCFLVGGTIYGTMLVGLWATFSWLPTWAQSFFPPGQGQSESGIVMAVLGVGGMVGGAFSGVAANVAGRKWSLLVAFAGAFIASFVLLETNARFTAVVYAEAAILALFFGVSQGVLAVYIPELFPIGIRSTATGICFNAGRVVTAGAVFFVGALVPVLGGYGNAIFAFSAAYVLGFIAAAFGRETSQVQL
jgi:MFS family permease